MNESLPDNLYNGILLCTAIYLILLGLVNFFSKKTQNILLASICYVLGVLVINNLFWPVVNESILFSLLVGAGKSIFIGPLVFLYLLALKGPFSNRKKVIFKNLAPPLIFHIVYLFLKFGLSSYYQQHYIAIVDLFTIIGSVFFAIYFYWALVILKGIKRRSATKKTKQIVYLFYILIAYFVIGKVYSIASSFIVSDFWPNNFLSLNRYFFMPVAIFLYGLLIIYTTGEMKWIRAILFKGKSLNGNTDVNYGQFDSLFEKYFTRDKIFTHQELNLKKVSELFGVPSQSIRMYLRTKFDTTFKEYVNQLRVEELKKILLDDRYSSYTLVGISNMVGFKSSATFYRVFKKYVGQSPQQYLQSKRNSDLATPPSS